MQNMWISYEKRYGFYTVETSTDFAVSLPVISRPVGRNMTFSLWVLDGEN
jgi:hypothetical protein